MNRQTNKPSRSRRRVKRSPDENGNITMTLEVSLPEDVYNFLEDKCDKNRQSFSALSSVLLTKHKEKLEKLGL